MFGREGWLRIHREQKLMRGMILENHFNPNIFIPHVMCCSIFFFIFFKTILSNLWTLRLKTKTMHIPFQTIPTFQPIITLKTKTMQCFIKTIKCFCQTIRFFKSFILISFKLSTSFLNHSLFCNVSCWFPVNLQQKTCLKNLPYQGNFLQHNLLGETIVYLSNYGLINQL